MAIEQPTATNKLKSPSHSTLHRIIASSVAAPVKSIAVQDDGKIRFGDTAGSNYQELETTGFQTHAGSALPWEDLRLDLMTARNGVVSPTSEVGFRGDANHLVTNFVHNQADELQFTVQFPHSVKTNSTIFPHVHFSPWIAGGANNAVRFILDYYWIDIDSQFPALPSQYQMADTWAGNKQWYHFITESGTGINHNPHTPSSIMKCRLYRENTVANNLQGKITVLYFDIHYQADTLGSRAELTK